MATETLRPDAAGDLTNIPTQLPASGAHWDKVDEAEADGDTTMVRYVAYVDGQWKTDLYNLPASSGSGTINKITLYFRVAGFGGSIAVAKGAIKSDSTVTETAAKNPQADFGEYQWGTYTQEWAANPADSGAWEWADIDALQIGVSLLGSNTYKSQCTQVYVVVDYTTGPSIPVVMNAYRRLREE